MKTKKILLIVLFLILFNLSYLRIQAKSDCGSEWKKIDKPEAATCSVKAMDSKFTTLPTMAYRCNLDTDSTGNYKSAQMKFIKIYKGSKSKHDNKPVATFDAQQTFGNDCIDGGAFTPSKPLEENQDYYVIYEYMYFDKSDHLFWIGAETRTTQNDYSFKTKVSQTTKAPKSDTCSVDVPKEQIDTVSFVIKYKCSGNAKATSYGITKDKETDFIINDSINKKESGSGSIAVKNLAPGTSYQITFLYKVKKEDVMISKNVSTLNESQTTVKISSGKPHDSVKERASYASLNIKTKKYKVEDGNTTCDDLSVKDLIDEYWNIVVILAPIALILLITIDFTKAVVSGDGEQLKKSSNAALKRTIATVVLLMLPLLLSILLGWFGIEFCI